MNFSLEDASKTYDEVEMFIKRNVLDPYPQQIIIGPIVKVPREYRLFGFTVSAAKPDGEPHHAQLCAEDEQLCEIMRVAALMILVTSKPALVIHDVDTEIQAARMCMILWPTEKSKVLYQKIKLEAANIVGHA